MTFEERLASLPTRLTLKECVLHPIQLIRFSKIVLKQETKSWKYESHEGMSAVDLIAYFATFSVVFSVICIFTTAIPIFFVPSISTDLINNYGWIFMLEGILFGCGIGYVFTIEAELESVNKTLLRLNFISKLKRSKENGSLNGLLESIGTKYFQHEYFREN